MDTAHVKHGVHIYKPYLLQNSGWPRHGTDTLTRRILTRHDTELIDTIDIDTP